MAGFVLKNPLVVSEFPKSGGSWIVSMLGDALGVPCRDIYMHSDFSLFEWRKHPWYVDAKELDFPASSVIKSHELPGSEAINFEATTVHLVRDGRDVIVSKFFFDTDFCVKNGIMEKADINFDEYVERTAGEWAHYVRSWSDVDGISTIRYEDFVRDPVNALDLFLTKQFGVSLNPQRLSGVVSKFSKAKFSASLDAAFSHNTFVRRGVAGDWINHFSPRNLAAYEAIAGDAHRKLGYSL